MTECPERLSKIALIYIDSGGGHRAAATALCEVFRQQERPWDVELLCIQDLLNSIDFIRKTTGIPFQDVYNIMLRRGWTFGSGPLIRLMHQIIRACHNAQLRVLEKQWRRSRPDLVVSLIPHYNRALKESLDLVWPGTPYVTLLTDIADYPPHFWIEPMNQYVICGSDRAVEQARVIGIPGSQILKASGMILNPKFYEPLQMDRSTERVRIGLKPQLPTGLVLFGGEGSMDIVRIAENLNRTRQPLQLILICGRDEAAAAAVRGLKTQIPMFVTGFTNDVPFYMELSDFLIGKPGPGCISEALAKRLPVIVQRNAWTLAHESYNVDWIEQEGLGLVLSSFTQIGEAVQTLLEPDNYGKFHERVSSIHNRALFEIPDMLAAILATSASRCPLPGAPAVTIAG